MDKSPKTKVKVVVRVRPALKPDAETCVNPLPSQNAVQIENHRNTKSNLQYDFSSVYNHTATQHDIFSECVEPYLKHSFQGQNVSIFAYGPTGAGKTHTMLGLASDPGIIPRVIKHLFKMIETEKSIASPSSGAQCPQTTIKFSYLEIYNEKVRDLLVNDNSDLPIREDMKHNIFVAGLKEEFIDGFQTFKQYFGPACSNRTVAATKLNEHSSRSHSILLLKVHRKVKGKEYIGKIYLIDLAGSEDNRRTGNKGIRLKESGAINKSLFVLGEVVDAINNNSARIPYRNSKLTRLLQDSIGGSCHSIMVTNIAPETAYYYDTYCTLNFASKSKKIVNVNTTSCIDENAQSQVSKPVVALKPNKNSGSKKGSTPPDESLSNPLVRRQNEWEMSANQRIAGIEEELNKLRAEKRQLTKSKPFRRPGLMEQTFVISSDPPSSQSSSSSSDGSPDIVYATPDPWKLSNALRDRGNLFVPGHRQRQLKRVLDSGPSCSPLFQDTPPAKKTKKQSRKTCDDSTTPKVKGKQLLQDMSSQNQADRNTAFLEALNTANVKDLQQLQTIGVKRAKLICDWRAIHGKFNTIDNVGQIPGFSQKYMENLLRRNLIS